jgi:hypothetical protein
MWISEEKFCDMHKFVFPSSDAYIDSHPDYRSYNFGLDEILEVSSVNFTVKTYQSASAQLQAITDFVGLRVISLNGSITGSITGSASNVSGSVIGCGLVIPESSHC